MVLTSSIFFYLLINGIILTFVQSNKVTYRLIKEDLPYIACDVCLNTVEELFHASDLIRKTKPKNKLDELDIILIIENISNPNNQTGEWIRSYDIIESIDKGKRYLSLIHKEGISKCKNECLTISESCRLLLQDDIDADDLSAMLYKNKVTLEQAKDKICKKWTNRCIQTRKSLPNSYKRIDEMYEIQSDKELEMERMMESMESMGMGANMYTPDELKNYMGDGGDEYGDEFDPYSNMMLDPYSSDSSRSGLGTNMYTDEEEIDSIGTPFKKAGSKFEI